MNEVLRKIFDGQNIEQLTVLVVTAMVTAVGTVLPNLSSPARPHNSVRLWSEATVSHQITYTAFFIGLFTNSAIGELGLWYRSVCCLTWLLSFLFLALGLLNNKEHERIVAQDHACGANCTGALTPAGEAAVRGYNSKFALISLSLTLGLIFTLQFGKKSNAVIGKTAGIRLPVTPIGQVSARRLP